MLFCNDGSVSPDYNLGISFCDFLFSLCRGTAFVQVDATATVQQDRLEQESEL